MPDPNQIWAQGDELSLGARQLNMWTRGAQLAHQALGGRSVSLGASDPRTLTLLVRNDHAESLPAYALTRWSGAPLIAPAVDDALPELVLRTLTGVTAQIGVVPQSIAAGNIGPLQIVGVAWARCRGAIHRGEYVKPASDFWGVLDATMNSGVIALAEVEGESLIPVFLDRDPGCGNTWYLSAEGLPSGGEIDFAITVNGVTETITLACPSTLTETRTALEGHSEIGTGGVSVDVGGTLPLVNQKIVFESQPSEIALVDNRLERTWTAPPIYRWDAC